MTQGRLTCPHCGEDRLVEPDPVTERGLCLVCAKTWPLASVRSIARHVQGLVEDVRSLATVPPLTALALRRELENVVVALERVADARPPDGTKQR